MDSNKYKICMAVESDIPALSDLLSILFSQESEFIPDPEKQQQGLKMIISNPSAGSVFVLKSSGDSRPVGMVSLLFTVSTALGGRAAFLEDMIIHPEHRQKGLGSLLLNEAVRFARKSGLLRITLLTDHDNSEAIAFYKKNGFFESEMRTMRQLL